MSDIGQLFTSVSNVLRDYTILNLLKENKLLKSKPYDPLYGVKIQILEHRFDLGRQYQPEATGCILKLDKDTIICLINNSDGIHIRPVSYYNIRISDTTLNLI